MSFCYKISDAVIFDIFEDVFFQNRSSEIINPVCLELWQSICSSLSVEKVVNID